MSECKHKEYTWSRDGQECANCGLSWRLCKKEPTKPKFVIVRCDDWEGLYKDGKLVCEGHEVSIDVILAQMGLELEEWRADDFLDAYERNRLPEKLSDVIKDA